MKVCEFLKKAVYRSKLFGRVLFFFVLSLACVAKVMAGAPAISLKHENTLEIDIGILK